MVLLLSVHFSAHTRNYTLLRSLLVACDGVMMCTYARYEQGKVVFGVLLARDDDQDKVSQHHDSDASQFLLRVGSIVTPLPVQ